jgi:type I restriction enzyme, S subunit
MSSAHRLDEVCEIVMGQAPSGRAYNTLGQGWPLIAGAGDFHGTCPATTKHTTEASKLSQRGDIVLGIRASIGEKVWADGVYCLGRGVAALRAKPAVDIRFLWHWLTHVETRLAAKAKGATFKQVNRQDIGELQIRLPNLIEQRRIADVLDRAEALRAKRRAALAQLGALANAIFLDLFGDPINNPKRWPDMSLGDLVTFVGGGTPSRARAEFFDGSICWATSKDMKNEFLDDTEEHITEQAIAESATNLVPAGSILVVVKSKILARHLPVAIARVRTCFGQDLKAIKVGECCDVRFIASTLRLGSRWLLKQARGINTEGLTLDHLRAFPVPLPPLSSQLEYSRRLTSVENLKAGHFKSLAEMDALFASLQHRAFRGEL